MIFNGPHITKKTYTIPKIEEVEIDAAITLQAPTDPNETDPTWGDTDPSSNSKIEFSSYRPAHYDSPATPFGERPEY
jgi:hypothetical protein